MMKRRRYITKGIVSIACVGAILLAWRIMITSSPTSDNFSDQKVMTSTAISKIRIPSTISMTRRDDVKTITESLITDRASTGAEQPFSLDPQDAPAPGARNTHIDPRKLILDWQTARLERNWDTARILRNHLLEAGASIIPLLFEPLHSGDLEVECDTIRLLRQIGGPRATAMALGRILAIPRDHPDYQRYLSTLEAFDDRSAADWLIRKLGQTAHQSTRESLLAMLSAMDGNEVVAAIAHGIRHATDDLHRRDLIAGLLLQGKPGGVDALTLMIEHSEQPLPQDVAARALAMTGSREAVFNLAGAATFDENDRLALALAFVDSAYAQEALLELALDSWQNTAVRSSAVDGLANQGGHRIPPSIDNALSAEPDATVAAAMADNLNQRNQSSPAVTSSQSSNTRRGELWF